MMKRILALLLTLCMLCSLVPISTLADEAPDESALEAQAEASDLAPEGETQGEEESLGSLMADGLAAPAFACVREGARYTMTADAGEAFHEGCEVGIQYVEESTQNPLYTSSSNTQTVTCSYTAAVGVPFFCRSFLYDDVSKSYIYSDWQEFVLNPEDAAAWAAGDPLAAANYGLYVFQAERDGIYRMTLSGVGGQVFDGDRQYLCGFSGGDDASVSMLLDAGPHYFIIADIDTGEAHTLTMTFAQALQGFSAPVASMEQTGAFAAVLAATSGVPAASSYRLGAQYGMVPEDTDRTVIDERTVYDLRDLQPEELENTSEGTWALSLTPCETYAYRAYIADLDSGEYTYGEWQTFTMEDRTAALSPDTPLECTADDGAAQVFFSLDAGENGGFYAFTVSGGSGDIYQWDPLNQCWSSICTISGTDDESSFRLSLPAGKTFFQIYTAEPCTVAAERLVSAEQLPAPVLTAANNGDFTVTFTASVTELPLGISARLGFEYGVSRDGADVPDVVWLGALEDEQTFSWTLPAEPAVTLYARAFLHDDDNELYTYSSEWTEITPTAKVTELRPGDTVELTDEVTYFSVFAEEDSYLNLSLAGGYLLGYSLWDSENRVWLSSHSYTDQTDLILFSAGANYIRVVRDSDDSDPDDEPEGNGPEAAVSLSVPDAVSEITLNSVTFTMRDNLAYADVRAEAQIPLDTSFQVFYELMLPDGTTERNRRSTRYQYASMAFTDSFSIYNPGQYDQFRVILLDLDTEKEYAGAWVSFGFAQLPLDEDQTLTEADGWYRVSAEENVIYRFEASGETGLYLWVCGADGSSRSCYVNPGEDNAETWLGLAGDTAIHLRLDEGAESSSFRLTRKASAVKEFSAPGVTGLEPKLRYYSNGTNLSVSIVLQAEAPLGSSFETGVEYGRTKEGAVRRNAASYSGMATETFTDYADILVYLDAPMVYRTYILDRNGGMYYYGDWMELSADDLLQTLTPGEASSLTFPKGRSTVVCRAEIPSEDSYALVLDDQAISASYCKAGSSVSNWYTYNLYTLSEGTYYFQFTRSETEADSTLNVTLETPGEPDGGTVTVSDRQAAGYRFFRLTVEEKDTYYLTVTGSAPNVNYRMDGNSSWYSWSSSNRDYRELEAGSYLFRVSSADSGYTLTLKKADEAPALAPSETLTFNRYGENHIFTLDVAQDALYTFSWTGSSINVYYATPGSGSWSSISSNNGMRLKAGRYWIDVIGYESGGEATVQIAPVDTPLVNGNGDPLTVADLPSYTNRYYVLEVSTPGMYYYSWDTSSSSFYISWQKEQPDGDESWKNWDSGSLLYLEEGKYYFRLYSYSAVDETGYQLTVSTVTDTLVPGEAASVVVQSYQSAYYSVSLSESTVFVANWNTTETSNSTTPPDLYRWNGSGWETIYTSDLMKLPEGISYLRVYGGYSNYGGYTLTLSTLQTLEAEGANTITAPTRYGYAYYRMHLDEAGQYTVKWAKANEDSGSSFPTLNYQPTDGGRWNSLSADSPTAMEPGDYYLRVYSNYSTSGDYTLTLEKQTQSMNAGGSLTFSGITRDSYAFTQLKVTEAAPYYLVLTSAEGNSGMPGVSCYLNDRWTTWDRSNLVFLEAGEYSLRLSGTSSTSGDYTLTVRPAAETLTLGEAKEITGMYNGMYAWYKLSVDRETVCCLTLEKTGDTGTNLPNIYYAAFADGSLDSFRSWNASSLVSLAEGEYYIRVSGGNNVVNSCRLTLGPITQAITPEEAVSLENMTSNDYRYYTFAGKAGGAYSYSVNLTSGRSNPYVYYCTGENVGDWDRWNQGDVLIPGDTAVYLRVSGYSSYSSISFDLTLHELSPQALDLQGDNTLTLTGDALFRKISVDAASAGAYTYSLTLPENGNTPYVYCWRADQPGREDWTYWDTAESWNSGSAMVLEEGVYYLKFLYGSSGDYGLSFRKIGASASGEYALNLNAASGIERWTVDIAREGFYTFAFTQPLSDEAGVSLTVTLTDQGGGTYDLYQNDPRRLTEGRYILAVTWSFDEFEAAAACTIALEDTCKAITAGVPATEDAADGHANYRLTVDTDGVYRLDNPAENAITLYSSGSAYGSAWYNENEKILEKGEYLLSVYNGNQGISFTISCISTPLSPDGAEVAHEASGEDTYFFRIENAGWYTLSFSGDAWPENTPYINSLHSGDDYLYESDRTRYFQADLYTLRWTGSEAGSLSVRPLENRAELNAPAGLTIPAGKGSASVLVTVPADGFYRLCWEGERPDYVYTRTVNDSYSSSISPYTGFLLRAGETLLTFAAEASEADRGIAFTLSPIESLKGAGEATEIVFPAGERYVYYTFSLEEAGTYYISVGPEDLNSSYVYYSSLDYAIEYDRVNNSWYTSNTKSLESGEYIIRFDRGYDNEAEKRYTVSLRMIGEDQALTVGSNTAVFAEGQYVAFYRLPAEAGQYVLRWADQAPDEVYVDGSRNYGSIFSISGTGRYVRIKRSGSGAAEYACVLTDTPYETIRAEQTVNVSFSNTQRYSYYQIELEAGDYALTWYGSKPNTVRLYRVTGSGTSSVSTSDGLYSLQKGTYRLELIHSGDLSTSFRFQDPYTPLSLEETTTFQTKAYENTYFRLDLQEAGDYLISVNASSSGYLYFPGGSSVYCSSGTTLIRRKLEAGTVKLRFYSYSSANYSIKAEAFTQISGVTADAQPVVGNPFSMTVRVSAPSRKGVSYSRLSVEWSYDKDTILYSRNTYPNTDSTLEQVYSSSTQSGFLPGIPIYYRATAQSQDSEGNTVYDSTDWQEITLSVPAGTAPLTLGEEKTVNLAPQENQAWFSFPVRKGVRYTVSVAGPYASLSMNGNYLLDAKPAGASANIEATLDGSCYLCLSGDGGSIGEYRITVSETAYPETLTAPVLTPYPQAGSGLEQTVSIEAEAPLDCSWQLVFEYAPKGGEKTSAEMRTYGYSTEIAEKFRFTGEPGVEYVCRAYLLDNSIPYPTENDRIYNAGGGEDHWIEVPAAVADYTVTPDDPRIEIFLNRSDGALVSFNAGEDGGVYQIYADGFGVSAWDAARRTWVALRSYDENREVRYVFAPGTAWLQVSGKGECAFQLTRVLPEDGSDVFTAPEITVEFTKDYSASLTLSAIVPLGSAYELGYMTQTGAKLTIQDDYLDPVYRRTDVGALYQSISAAALYTMRPGETNTFTPYLYDWQEQAYYYGEPIQVTVPDETGMAELTLDETIYTVALYQYDYSYYRYTAGEDGSYLLNVDAPKGRYQIELFDPERGDWRTLGSFRTEANKLLDRKKGEDILLRISMNSWTSGSAGVLAVKVTRSSEVSFRAEVAVEAINPLNAQYTLTAHAPVGSSYELGLLMSYDQINLTRIRNQQVSMTGTCETEITGKVGMMPGITVWFKPYVYDRDRELYSYGEWVRYTAPGPDEELKAGKTAKLTLEAESSGTRVYGFTPAKDGYYRFDFTGPENSRFDIWNDPVSAPLYKYGDRSCTRLLAAGRTYYLYVQYDDMEEAGEITLKAEQITGTATAYSGFALSKADSATPFRMDLQVTGSVPQGSQFAYGVEYYLVGSLEDGSVETTRLQVFSTKDDPVYQTTGYPRDTVKGSVWINLLPGQSIMARVFLYDWDLETYIENNNEWQMFTNDGQPAALSADTETPVEARYYSFTPDADGVYTFTLSAAEPGLNRLLILDYDSWRSSSDEYFSFAGLKGSIGDYEEPAAESAEITVSGGKAQTCRLEYLPVNQGETVYLMVLVDPDLEDPSATLKAEFIGKPIELDVDTAKDVVMRAGETQIYYVDIKTDGFYRFSYLDGSNHTSSSLSTLGGSWYASGREFCGLLHKGERIYLRFNGEAGYYTLRAEQVPTEELTLGTALAPVPKEQGQSFYYLFTAPEEKAYEFILGGGADFTATFWTDDQPNGSTGFGDQETAVRRILWLSEGQVAVLRLTADQLPEEDSPAYSVLVKETPKSFTAPTIQIDEGSLTPYSVSMTLQTEVPYGSSFIMGIDYGVGGLFTTDLTAAEAHAKISSSGSAMEGVQTLSVLKPGTIYSYRAYIYDSMGQVYYHGPVYTFTTPDAETLTLGQTLTLTGDSNDLYIKSETLEEGRYSLKVKTGTTNGRYLYAMPKPVSWDGMNGGWQTHYYIYGGEYELTFISGKDTVYYYQVRAEKGESITLTLEKLPDDGTTETPEDPVSLMAPTVTCAAVSPFGVQLTVNTVAPEEQIYEVYVSFARDQDSAGERFLRVYPGGSYQLTASFDAEPGRQYHYRAWIAAAGQEEPLSSDWETFTMPALEAKALTAGETVDVRFNQELQNRYYAFTPAEAGSYELCLETSENIGAAVICRFMADDSWQTQSFSLGSYAQSALTWQLEANQTLYVTLTPDDWYGENHDYRIAVNQVTPAADFSAPTLTYAPQNDFGGYAALTAEVPLNANFALRLQYRAKGEEDWTQYTVATQTGSALGSRRTAEGSRYLYTVPGESYELRGVLVDRNTSAEYVSDILTVTAADSLSIALALESAATLTADKANKADSHYYSFTAEEEGFYEFTVTYEDYAARQQSGSFAIFDLRYRNFQANTQLLGGSRSFRLHMQAGERTFLRLRPGYTQDYTLTVQKLDATVLELTAPTVTADFTTDLYQTDYTLTLSAAVPLGSWFELGLQTKSVNGGFMDDYFIDGQYDYTDEGIVVTDRHSTQPGDTVQYRAYLYDWRSGQRYYSEWAEFTAPEIKELTLDQESWYRVNDQLRNTNRFYLFQAPKSGYYKVLLTGNGTVYSRYNTGVWSLTEDRGYLMKMEKGDVVYYRIQATARDDYRLLVTTVTPTVNAIQNLTLETEALSPDTAQLHMTAEVPLWSNFRTGFEYRLRDGGEPAYVITDTVYNSGFEMTEGNISLSNLYGLWQNLPYTVRSFVFDLDTGKTWYSEPQTLTLDPGTLVVTLSDGKAAESRVLEFSGTEGAETADGLIEPTDWRPTYFVFTAPEAGYYELSLSQTNGTMSRWNSYGNTWYSVYDGTRLHLGKNEALYLRFTPYTAGGSQYNSSYKLMIQRCTSDSEITKPVLTLNSCEDYSADIHLAATVPLEGQYTLKVSYRGDFWMADEESRYPYTYSTYISNTDQIDRDISLPLLPGKNYTALATLTVVGADGKETVYQSEELRFTTPDEVTRTLQLDKEMRTVSGPATQYDRYRFTAAAEGTYKLTVTGSDTTVSICANRYGAFTDSTGEGVYWFNLKQGQEVYLLAASTPVTGSMLLMEKAPEDVTPFQVDAKAHAADEPFALILQPVAEQIPMWSTFELYLQYGDSQSGAMSMSALKRTYFNWTDGSVSGKQLWYDVIPGKTYYYRGVLRDCSTGMEWEGPWNTISIPTDPMKPLILNQREALNMKELVSSDAYKFTAAESGFYDVVMDGYEGRYLELLLCSSRSTYVRRYWYTDEDLEKGCTRVYLEAGETLFVGFGQLAVSAAVSPYMGLTIQRFLPTVNGYELPTVELCGEAGEYDASFEYSAVVEPGQKWIYGIILSDGKNSVWYYGYEVMKQGYTVPMDEFIADSFSADLLPGKTYTVTPFLAKYAKGNSADYVYGQPVTFRTLPDNSSIPLTLGQTEDRYHYSQSRVYRFTAGEAGTYRFSFAGSPSSISVYDRASFSWVTSYGKLNNNAYTVRELQAGETVYLTYYAGSVEHILAEKIAPSAVTAVGTPDITMLEKELTPVSAGVRVKLQTPIGGKLNVYLEYYRVADGEASAVRYNGSSTVTAYDTKAYTLSNMYGLTGYSTPYSITENTIIDFTGMQLTPGASYRIRAVAYDSAARTSAYSSWLELTTPTYGYEKLTMEKGSDIVTSAFSVNPDNIYERRFSFTAPEMGAYTLTITGPKGTVMRRVSAWSDEIDREVADALLMDGADYYESYWRSETSFGYSDASLTLYLRPDNTYYFYVSPSEVGDYSVTITKGASKPDLAIQQSNDLRVLFTPTATGTAIIAVYDRLGKMIDFQTASVTKGEREDIIFQQIQDETLVKIITVDAATYTVLAKAISLVVQQHAN